MIKKLAEKPINFTVQEGDMLILSYGNDLRETEVLRYAHKGEPVHVNTAIVFEIENELGLKRGLGGVFGEKHESGIANEEDL